MNTYLIRIEWEDNGYVNSEVILTQQKDMKKATHWVITKFEKEYPERNYRITWAEDISKELMERYGVTVYMNGPHGVHDPFCSANRGQT